MSLPHSPGGGEAKLSELLERLAAGAGGAGVHPLFLDRAARGLLRAPGLPRRQRARAGDHRPSLSAVERRALRSRSADQDPRPSGVRTLLPCGGRAPRRARAAAGGGAGGRRLHGLGAELHRAGAGLGDRSGDRRLLPGVRLRDHRGGGGLGLRARGGGGAGPSGRLQVGARRSAWRAAASWSATRWSKSRARRTSAPSRSVRRSAARRSATAPGAARRMPSRKPRRRHWRRWRRDREGRACI